MPAKPKPVDVRFWHFVNKSGQCWNWTGARGGDHMHYGQMKVDGRAVRVHRISWMIHFGAIPAGMFVLHLCDNVLCVRPSHLYLGTHAENMRDRSVRGRESAAVVTAEIATVIRKEIAELTANGRKRPCRHTHVLAARYGISESSVRDIIKGRTWRNAEAIQPTLVTQGA